jgi:hypothetical protein
MCEKAPLLGCASFWLLFLAQARKSNSPKAKASKSPREARKLLKARAKRESFKSRAKRESLNSRAKRESLNSRAQRESLKSRAQRKSNQLRNARNRAINPRISGCNAEAFTRCIHHSTCA